MSFGYVYCITNPSMPGLCKIGFTTRPAQERLQEANQPTTWIPTPFIYEFFKYVVNPHQKEGVIHKILAKERVNPAREFFRVDVEKVRLLFDLMDAAVEPEVEDKVTGDDIVLLFLNAHVFPGGGTEPVTKQMVESVFKSWKRDNGHVAGNATKVTDMLVDAYGKPTRGEGWTNFCLKV